MSRFSKAQAEKAGWVFVHAQEERESALGGGQQGLRQTLPASYRAEKIVPTAVGGETLINEEADSIGLLLERINAYETTHGGYEDTTPVPSENPFTAIPELSLKDEPVEGESPFEAGDPHTADVVTEDDTTFSEHDYFNRQNGAEDAHAAFIERQRELELAKPIDPQEPTGEPQSFGEAPASEPEATEAAVEFAAEKGVDLSEVEPDKDGKITKRSVKRFLRRSK